MRQYPDLAGAYATALREAVEFVFSQFAPCAVVASGTIVRGNPSPSSDLDVYVVQHGSVRQRIQRFFHGVPAEIFVNPPGQVERYLEAEAPEGRPITAHMLSTGFTVFSGDDCLERLRRLGAAIIALGPDVRERDLLVRRYMAARRFEDAVDVAATDAETCTALLTSAVEEAVRYAFWSARRWQPRPKDALRCLGEVDAAAERLARAFYRATTLEERLELARALFDYLDIATAFFEWESEREPLA